MTLLTIPLDDDLRDWARGRVGADGHESEAAYVPTWIERDRREALAALEAALERGRASGVSGRTAKEIAAAERARVG